MHSAPVLVSLPETFTCLCSPDINTAADTRPMPPAHRKSDIPPLHDVDIRVLRVFKAVVECEGLSAAEERLGIGRSTISKHISGFETRLNMRLCERGRTGFSITAHGVTVYHATIELLDALESFRSKISSAKGRLSGNASLWTMDNSHNEAGNPLSRAIEQFSKREGNAQIVLNAADPKSVEEAVVSGAAHLGISIANTGMDGIVYRQLGFETTSLYCSASHPIAKLARQGDVPEDSLADCEFVVRSYVKSDRRHRFREVNSTASSGHVEATLQLILSGCYLGVLPDHFATRWMDNGRILRISNADYSGSTEVFLKYREKSVPNPTVSALIEDILDCYDA